ncbi:hypothetical protein [Xanthomarina gelatinilytica]|uniref:DUF6438 domain-containing protein n=1 Tax=Xanthomarina gelatinilytica TaxID=1137281 RepID=UPI003AA83B8B
MKKLLCFMVFVISVINIQSQTKKQEAKIIKVEFLFDGYANHPKYDFIIYCDRTIIFNAKSNNFLDKLNKDIAPLGSNVEGVNIRSSEIKGIFKSNLARKELTKIESLINLLNLEFEQKNFNSELLHNSTVLLKVKFKDNNVYKIYDIGANGSKNLIKLYKFLDELRFKKDWE